MRLGAHLSIAKGLDKAAETAANIGANTFQFFTRNPRGGRARIITEKEAASWQAKRRQYDLFPVVGHLPYTVNMAAVAEKPFAFAKMVISDDLQRMDAVGVEYLVIHPGSHVGAGREKGIKKIIECLEEAFMPSRVKTMLLLETMAGQGTEVGSLQGINEILSALGHPERLGVCLDTCHLTAAGYDFLQKDEVARLADDLAGLVGLERVKALHINDSKFPPNSKRDRHARIGQGYLGREGILNVIAHPVFSGLPLLLETPVDDYLEYKDEIELLRSWTE
ncbi:MAG TPA: deoxyribonuclease IV [Firmicutes bacterium]|jgi:deoxyribonuclease-4|nr:deoxyribonuclease IV [Bacillota bacterium]